MSHHEGRLLLWGARALIEVIAARKPYYGLSFLNMNFVVCDVVWNEQWCFSYQWKLVADHQ